MRYLVLPFMLLALTGCQAITTFDKYATMRLYEVYETDNLSACDYKPKFRDCMVNKRSFNVRISDDKSKIALVVRTEYAYFGFTRDDFARQTQPLRDFLIWTEDPAAKDKQITQLRKAGNVGGSLYDNREVQYQFDYLHTRADIPLLVVKPGENADFYGLTIDEVKNLLSVMDAWYAGTFSGKQLT
ncbi:hypothetical protein A0G02_16135 [Pectobacterium peruviense]|uniref:hypothetical protein n=1 Tax=Pectobacterium peruviense TaxID=2066479 RepID=UPI000C7ABF06|nr:hypothetical protein [Pectobacterium peruviense]PKX82052.1 hypothetical protein A0G02_16135 [Pectobacterium peruviense]